MSITIKMMINNNDDYNLADSILERTFLKVGNKVEKGTTLRKMAQHPEQLCRMALNLAKTKQTRTPRLNGTT